MGKLGIKLLMMGIVALMRKSLIVRYIVFGAIGLEVVASLVVGHPEYILVAVFFVLLLLQAYPKARKNQMTSERDNTAK